MYAGEPGCVGGEGVREVRVTACSSVCMYTTRYAVS